MQTVAKVISEFRRLRVAPLRGTPYQERESSRLQSTIGSMFVQVSAALGEPFDYSGLDADI